MTKILFVCHGNICRSPMAEFLMKEMVRQAGLEQQVYIESAAATTEEIGNDLYPPAKRKLTEKGIPFQKRGARLMTKRDYERFDYIIGMDRENLWDMRSICGGDRDHKISLLMEWAGSDRDVADPWYTRDFEATFQDLTEGCSALLHAVKKEMEK